MNEKSNECCLKVNILAKSAQGWGKKSTCKKEGKKFNRKCKVNSKNFPVFINYDVFFPDILPYLVDLTIFKNKSGKNFATDGQYLSVCKYSNHQNREEIRNSLM